MAQEDNPVQPAQAQQSISTLAAQVPSQVEFGRALYHEMKLTLGGTVVVVAVWWLLSQVLSITFPIMHIGLIGMALLCFIKFDVKEYPTMPSIPLLLTRAAINFGVFLIGLIAIGPFGVLLTASVAANPLGLVFAFIAVATLIAFFRTLIHLAMIVTSRLT